MTRRTTGIGPGCSARQWGVWLLAMAALLLLLVPAFLLSPSIPGGWQLGLWWGLSLSASKYGLIWTALGFALLPGLPPRRLPGVLLPMLVIIGLGAWTNEHLVKPAVAQPRPNILFLASAEAGPVLTEGAEAFYALPDKASRSRRLDKGWDEAGLALPDLLRDHWTEETGFSFPSGHAFAAAALAGWLSLWILCEGKRYGVLFLLWGWMLAVCYSRIQLGVHRPEDILAGAAEGMLLVLLARLALARIFHKNAENQS